MGSGLTSFFVIRNPANSISLSQNSNFLVEMMMPFLAILSMYRITHHQLVLRSSSHIAKSTTHLVVCSMSSMRRLYL